MVDDASTDDTVKVVEDWISNSDSDIEHRILSLGKNSGPAAARNAGIRAAHGEWIAFLDADDVYMLECLEVLLEAAGQFPEAAMFFGMAVIFGSGRENAQNQQPESSQPELVRRGGINISTNNYHKLSLREFVIINPVYTTSVMVRKDAIEQAGGFDESFRGPEDYDLWMRIAAKYSIIRIDMPLARHREVAGSLSMDEQRFLPEVLRVIEKAFGQTGVLHEYSAGKDMAIASQFRSASWMAASTPRGGP